MNHTNQLFALITMVAIQLISHVDSIGFASDLSVPGDISTNQRIADVSPGILSVSPSTGSFGTLVTILGSGFSTDGGSNIVYFGPVRATVTSASSGSLVVTVPRGAASGFVTVTVAGLTAYSPRPFVVTFGGGGTLAADSFFPRVEFVAGSHFRWGVLGDWDGDGRPDIAETNDNNTLTILHNISSEGSIGPSSFARLDIAVGLRPYDVATADLDGDGKLDIVVVNNSSSSISVLRNTSSLELLSFTRQDFTVMSAPIGVTIGDLDLDGKPDIIVSGSIFRNLSVPGQIVLSPRIDIYAPNGGFPMMAVADIDGDTKPDLLLTKRTDPGVLGWLAVFKNLSTPGNIVLGSELDFPAGRYATGIGIADIDNDGKIDVVVTSGIDQVTDRFISVFRNTSISGSIGFDTRIDLSTGTGAAWKVKLADMDGDQRIDIAAAIEGNSVVSIYPNTSAEGAISFGNRLDVPTGLGPLDLTIGDLDLDGRPDLVTATLYSSNGISIHRNLGPLRSGTLAVQVENVEGWEGPGTEAKVRLYNGSGQLVDSQFTNNNSLATFQPVVEGNDYSYTVSYTPSDPKWLFGTQYWGRKNGVTIVGDQTTIDTLVRNAPYALEVHRYNVVTNELIVSDTVPIGLPIRIELSVKNPDNSGAQVQVVRGRLTLDTNKVLPFELDLTGDFQTMQKGTTTKFSFLFTPRAPGSYFEAGEVFVQVNGVDIETDGGIWGMAPLLIASPRATPPWFYTNTGSSHSIIVPASLMSSVRGAPIAAGDFLGVFFDSSGTQACAGYERWTGSGAITVTAYGDAASTPVKDGFADGEVFKWKLFRANEGRIFDVEATYSATGGIVTQTNKFFPNGVSQVQSLIGALPPWAFKNSGMNHTIIIPTSANPNVNGVALSAGDYISVFYDSTGALACAGYERWNGSTNITVSAFGDDPTTAVKDGLAGGEILRWKIFRLIENQVFDAEAQYAPIGGIVTNTNAYETNGISRIDSLNGGVVATTLNLRAGWSLISSYAAPRSLILDSLFNPVINDVIVLKNATGNAYIPSVPVNTIGLWSITEGYQIKMGNARSLDIRGQKIVPDSNPISLPQGWSIMPYLRDTQMAIATVLSGIASDLLLVKDQDGKTYIPTVSLNAIGTMKPGQGYQIKMANARLLQYPSSAVGGGNIAKASDQKARNVITSGPPLFYTNTGVSHTIIIPSNTNPTIDGTPLTNGDYICVFYDSSGTPACAGYELWTGNGSIAVSAFGDDLTTPQKDGLATHEKFAWKIWRHGDGRLFGARATYQAIGSFAGMVTDTSMYSTNGISAIGAVTASVTSVNLPDMPATYMLSQNYPNPFNPSTMISFGLPSASRVTLVVLNALGQEVATLIHGYLDAGYHDVKFDGQGLASGVYFYRMQAGSFTQTKKLLLLR